MMGLYGRLRSGFGTITLSTQGKAGPIAMIPLISTIARIWVRFDMA